MEAEKVIFGLIAQAEDAQKQAVVLQRVAEDALNKLPEGARSAIRDASREILVDEAKNASTALLGASSSLLRTKAEIDAGISSFRFNVALATAAVFLLGCLFMGGVFYFGLQWTLQERDKAEAELAKINRELAETAFVTDFQGQTGKWVQIDNSRKILKSNDGRTFALMPPR